MDIPSEAHKAVPGVLGAISAVLMMRENWRRGVAMVLPSAALSWYGGAFLSEQVGMPEGLAGFLLGLAGMAFIVKVIETWDRFDLGSILGSALRKVLGLPEKEA